MNKILFILRRFKLGKIIFATQKDFYVDTKHYNIQN